MIPPIVATGKPSRRQGLLFLLVHFDPRIRSARLIEQHGRYPLLTSIPAYPTPRERRRQFTRLVTGAAMVIGIFVVYGLLFAYRIVVA